jgi:hypothetical protein
MNEQNYFLLLIAIAVLLPIIPSVILFKFLPSDATVQGPFKGMKIKFGGAIAVYFVILIVIVGLIESKKPSAPSDVPYEVWQITGQTELEGGEQLLPTDITINPPYVSTSGGGTYRLDVPVFKTYGNIVKFPTISVGHHGFNTVDIHLSDSTTTILGRLPVQVTKDAASKSIVIGKFSLNRIAPYNEGGRR